MRAAWYERNGPAAEVLTVGELFVRSRSRGGAGEGDLLGAQPDGREVAGGLASDGLPWWCPIRTAPIIDKVGSASRLSRWRARLALHRPVAAAVGTRRHTVVPAGLAVRLPDSTTFAEGACLGIPGVTAHRCLFADGPVAGQPCCHRWRGRGGPLRRPARQVGGRPGHRTVSRREGGPRHGRRRRHTVNYRMRTPPLASSLTGGRRRPDRGRTSAATWRSRAPSSRTTVSSPPMRPWAMRSRGSPSTR
jgi:hypothetical protein